MTPKDSTTQHVDDICRYLDRIADLTDEIQVSAGLASQMPLALRERIATFVGAVQEELATLRCHEDGCQALGIVPRGLDGLFCATHDAERVLCVGCGHDVRLSEAHYQDGNHYHRMCLPDLPDRFADYPFVAGL